MRKLIVPALAAGALFVPTVAHADETYVGVSGGIVLPSNSNNSGEFDAAVAATADFDEIPAGTPVGWTTEFDTGYTISGQIGRAFDSGLRVELEVAYSDYGVDTHRGLTVGGTDIDGVDVAVLTRGAADAANPTVGDVIADGQGSVSNIGVFANVLYDLNKGGGIEPYVGVGLGYQDTSVDFSPSGVDVGDDNDGGFAWQGIVGASYGFSEAIDGFLQYNYRANFKDADIPLNLLPATLSVESEQSLITAGIRVGF
ncbi:outer membrane beta-barrel protein [Altererythrobacter sp. ZODW24]|uniref:P44/Msp2 family outer membrane protein n=1 Tax=Altererythrobacter sp. ZODW24 TaxID=2185142 RepID=UPI000DF802F2|nr:outer membrane beta-barrel protein [Altererythrobacter sp. ZODW24]